MYNVILRIYMCTSHGTCRESDLDIHFNLQSRSAVMSFKAKPSVHSLRIATGRARCRGKCKRCVPKGDVRVHTTAFVMPGRVTCWSRCVGCIDQAFAEGVLAVYGRAARVPAHEAVPEAAAAAARAMLERAAVRRAD